MKKFITLTTQKDNGDILAVNRLKKKLYLHLKASVDLYTFGQGTTASLQVFEFSCIIIPLESNSAHF